ncbi:MAG: hypothetical protein JST89_03145 [Cyanobacteria bacterium SZAS-4]|nr:hypothetical protein [Cyanobacteria bacterium SZAS-4]
MRNLERLTADKLLSIETPESLFSNSLSEAKAEYRFLAGQWHPDRKSTPDAMRVFMHIVQLYRDARQKMASGKWNESCEKIEEQIDGWRKFRLLDGSIKTCKYRISHPFELGTTYVADNSIVFELDKEFEQLFQQGRKRIHMLPLKNNSMALEMSKYLPQVQQTFRTESSNILVVRKTPDQLLLRDVINHFGGKLTPANHIGWILNNLLNLACYLEWAGVTHNAISATTVVISPLRHNLMLLGGWWYSTKAGQVLSYIPEETLKCIPPDILRNKRADARVDLELIKSVGREILGDASGAHLTFGKSLPPDLVDWLQLPSSGSAFEDYKTFKREVLPSAFGPPKFVNMQLDADLLYKEK